MILQTLDIRNNCKGIYHNGRFILKDFEKHINDYSLAWKHSALLEDEDFKYLFLLTKGRDLSLFSKNPELFMASMRKIQAQEKASRAAKVDLEEECFFDLIPKRQLEDWFQVRQTALQCLWNSVQEGEDYKILHKAHVLAENISNQDLLFGDRIGRVLYNIFGSATGRLTTKKGSIPVLTLKKDQRELIKPQNDALVEFDLNAAEVRTLIALSGREQPNEDIHQWLIKNVFGESLNRDEAKVKLFAWLYNFSNSDVDLDKFFSRQIFRDFYCPETESLKTPFGRNLKVEERKAQNYLLQSTTSDIVIDNVYKIMKMLKSKRSKVAFTLHDSVILDMAKEDIPILKNIKDQFEATRWGNFYSTCKIGKDFGNLKEIKI